MPTAAKLRHLSAWLVCLAALSFMAQAQTDAQKIDAERCDAEPADVHACTRLAKAGIASAQHILGGIYRLGLGVQRDDTVALDWYSKAASAGHAPAQRAMGFMLLDGNGAPADATQARQWMSRAADKGDVLAQNAYAEMLLLGTGGPKDPVTARAMLTRAAALIDARGKPGGVDEDECSVTCISDTMRNLARVLEHGVGGVVDEQEARRRYGHVYLGAGTKSPLSEGERFVNRGSFKNGSSLPKQSNFLSQAMQRCGNQAGPPRTYMPASPSRSGIDREIDLTLLVSDPQLWVAQKLDLQLQTASVALESCGISLRQARIWQYSATCDRSDLNDLHAPSLPVYFVPKQGASHVAGEVPITKDEVRIFPLAANNFSLPDGGALLAHELGHALGVQHPSNFTPSVMQRGLFFKVTFAADECQKMRTSPYLLPSESSRQRIGMPVGSKEAPRWSTAWRESIVQRLLPLNKKAALFYDLRMRDRDPGTLSRVKPYTLNLLAQEYGMSWRDTAKIAEFAHHWRDEDGWVTEATEFDLRRPADLYWLPGILKGDISELIDQNYHSIRRAVAYSGYSKDALSTIGPRLLEKNGARLTASKLKEIESQNGVRVHVDGFPDGYLAILVNGNLHFIVDDGQVLDDRPSFLNLVRGPADWAQARQHPHYNRAVETDRQDAVASDASAPPPTGDLRQKDFGALTPVEIPGGQVVGSAAAWRSMLRAASRGAGAPQTLAAMAEPVGLPGSIDLSFAAGGGSLQDQTQKRLAAAMRRVAPRKDSALLTYCHGSDCWQSYNLGLRLIALGYTDVRWMRDGLRGWIDNGLPLAVVQAVTE